MAFNKKIVTLADNAGKINEKMHFIRKSFKKKIFKNFETLEAVGSPLASIRQKKMAQKLKMGSLFMCKVHF